MKRISLLIVICFVVIFSFSLIGSTPAKADDTLNSLYWSTAPVYVVPHVNFTPTVPYGIRYYDNGPL